MGDKIKNSKIAAFIKEKQVFIKYIFVAGSSFLLDLGLFTLFSNLLATILQNVSILVSTVFARVISSFFNYVLNRNVVFSSDDKKVMDKTTLVKYYVLVIVQMLISAALVTVIFNLSGWNKTLIKMPVDVVIFIVNYIIQKKVIFNK